jgi:hypothetical protein
MSAWIPKPRWKNEMPRSVLTFAYIVEPPDYQYMACKLLASIRCNFGPEVAAVGYCPAHRIAGIDPCVHKAHEIMGAEILPMDTIDGWDTPYPHGNKILAALQPRDSDYSAFVDSDVLFLKPNTPENLCREGHVSCSAAASLRWTGDEIWDLIWPAFGMDVPPERLPLMRERRGDRVPYFSSGLVVFEENGKTRFPDVWYETALALDKVEEVPNRRPYLDQFSLPVAIKRAGLNWNVLPEEQHFILGGRMRGNPLPKDKDIFTVHYRNSAILRETGLKQDGLKMFKRQTGVKFVQRLEDAPAG